MKKVLFSILVITGIFMLVYLLFIFLIFFFTLVWRTDILNWEVPLKLIYLLISSLLSGISLIEVYHY